MFLFKDFPQRQIDYVVFPMSLFWEGQESGKTVRSGDDRTFLLSLGAQDREGWMTRIVLGDLLRNMVVVEGAFDSEDSDSSEQREKFLGKPFIEYTKHLKRKRRERRRRLFRSFVNSTDSQSIDKNEHISRTR